MPIKGAKSKVPLSGHFKWLSQCQDWFTKSGCPLRILKLETWNFAWDLILPIHMLYKKRGSIWELFEKLAQPNGTVINTSNWAILQYGVYPCYKYLRLEPVHCLLLKTTFIRASIRVHVSTSITSVFSVLFFRQYRKHMNKAKRFDLGPEKKKHF